MATKSKKFKHSVFFKVICFLLSVLFFALSATSALICTFFSVYTNDVTNIFSAQKLPSYKESDYFNRLIFEYTNCAANLSRDLTDEQIETALLSEMEVQVEDNVNSFMRKKAEIIRSELYYVATNYDRQYENDYYYNAYNDLTTTTTKPYTDVEEVTEPVNKEYEETTSFEYNTNIVVEVDPYAPYNVRYCQYLLNTVSGLGFLQYENLVRAEALTEQRHNFTFNVDTFSYYVGASHSMSIAYNNSENTVRDALDSQYQKLIEDVQYQYSYEMSNYKETLSSLKNFKYLLIDGEKIYSNIPQNERTTANITHHDVYGIYKDGELKTVGLNDNVYEMDANLRSKSNGDYTLYFYVEDDMIASDTIYNAMIIHELYSDAPPLSVFIFAILSLILAIVFFIIIINICSHKNGFDEPVMSSIDKVPCDLHFLVVGAICVCAYIYWLFTADNFWRNFPTDHTRAILFIVLTTSLSALVWALIIEWSTSFARLLKCGKKNSIIVKLFTLLKKLIKKLVTLLKKGFKLVFYKNVKLSVFTTIGIFVYVIINVILSLLLNFSLVWLFVLIPYNIAVIILVLLFMRHLDRIIKASDDIGSPIPDSDKMPGALKTLADNISKTNTNLQKAVEQTVKNERMKTDLITNVSHDLRTPLTAIISYVGLLEKCDIDDPTAKEYLAVLSEKSEKLKQLINDLIEASKVSSGNITLNISKLNLTELVVQATVEATPEFEKNGLDIRISDNNSAINVLSDSAKTYRIIENLLSNARKYSAENSRVYITVSEDESYGIFEIKNVSAEPLNIEADELMERFVRGDKSRSRDGNGLGLSIAKELCSAQNGKLSLSIDGDLFKATVYLPKK